MQVALILLLLFGLLVAVIAIQNATPVTLTLLVFSVPNVPVSVLMLGALVLGALLAALVSLGGWLRTRRRLREQAARIAQLEAELARRAPLARPAASPPVEAGPAPAEPTARPEPPPSTGSGQ